MKNFFLFMLFLAAWQGTISAQDIPLPKYQISLSYFGESITHRGIRLGFSTPISQNLSATEESSTIQKGWVLGGYITYYKHPRNHQGIMLTGAIGRQRVGESGFLTAINLEAGYMLSLLDGATFEWDGQNIVEASKSSSHAVFGFNGGAGWDFKKSSDLPISFQVVPHFYFQAPYNSLLAPRFALETKLSLLLN